MYMYARPLESECVWSDTPQHASRRDHAACDETATCVARLGLRLYVSRMLLTLRCKHTTRPPINVSQPTSNSGTDACTQWCT